MLRIESLTADCNPVLLAAAYKLFSGYEAFLRANDVKGFRFDRFAEEIQTLPREYAGKSGELLIGFEGDSSVACVAYREFAGADHKACEIKRLFVDPSRRGSGYGKQMVIAALNRARERGFLSAFLDTEPGSMAVAHRTYLELGFVPYQPADSDSEMNLIFLRKSLTETGAGSSD